MSAQDVDVDALIRGQGSRRRWLVLAGALGVVAAAAIAFLAVQSGESDVVITPQSAEATTGPRRGSSRPRSTSSARPRPSRPRTSRSASPAR